MGISLEPGRTAVVAVHMQGHVAGPGAFAPFFAEQVAAREVVPAAARLVAAVRDAGGQVVYTRVAWSPDYSDLDANSPLLQIARQSNALTEGDPLTEILEEMAPAADDIVHTHKRIGGLTPELDQRLRAQGIDTLLFCGVATNASVEGTARQASDAGYRVLIVEDCCAAATELAHQASIESMGLIGEITDSASAIAAIQEGARP